MELPGNVVPQPYIEQGDGIQVDHIRRVEKKYGKHGYVHRMGG